MRGGSESGAAGSGLGNATIVALIAGLLVLSAWLVYSTGGTGQAYAHVVYIPILIAAAYLGTVGAVITALVAGVVVLGPWMPLEVSAERAQPVEGWLFRTLFLMAIAAVAGWLIHRIRVEHRERLRGRTYNAVSGMPNRTALEERVTALSTGVSRREYAVLVVRVNNFEQISNVLGAQTADRLPEAMGRRLLAECAACDDVYHSHANKLTLVLPTAALSVHEAVRIILSAFEDPIDVDGIPVYLDIAIGSVVFTAGAGDTAQILRRVNIALEAAREEGRRHVQYAEQDDSQSMRNFQLLGQVPDARRAEAFRLHFQPKVDLQTGQPIAAEALIRWHHRDRGLLLPSAFMPLVENTALIDGITEWVIYSAVRQMSLWERAGINIPLAVNVSPRNIHEGDLAANVERVLETFRLAPGQLEVEVTESAAIADPRNTLSQLRALKALGVTVSLDDFGTGYTSLRYLTFLPVDKIKIDQSFVRRLDEGASQHSVVQAMINLARQLDLTVVAEGIETASVARRLAEMGCHQGQGFYFSEPMRAQALTSWFRRQARLRSHVGPSAG